MNRKLIYQEEIEIVDNKTGEVDKKTKTRGFKIKSEPSYVRLYSEGIMMLSKLTKTEMKILCGILKYADFSNTIEFNASKKRKIADEINTTVNNLTKCISTISKKGVMKRIDTGEYQLNPLVFGKGQWKDILKLREEYEAV